jgi:hypothetical protein
MQIFNVRKKHDMQDRDEYYIKISSRFAALENFDDDDYDDINRGWESIRENMEKQR